MHKLTNAADSDAAGIDAPGIDAPGIDAPGIDSDSDAAGISDTGLKKYPARGGALFIKHKRFYSLLFASIKSLILLIIDCASRAIDCKRHADLMSILASVVLSIFITSIISQTVRLILIILNRYLSRSDMMRSLICASAPDVQSAIKSVNFSNKSFLFIMCPLMRIYLTLIRCCLMMMPMRFYRDQIHRGHHNNRG